ncbi:hypothetical protein [Streptomyces chattanoogensis]|uniref:hypothetical protein n=1 Tax=Streptomyces chattanoogensis TaxID=66876 RepID=UPI00368F4D49
MEPAARLTPPNALSAAGSCCGRQRPCRLEQSGGRISLRFADLGDPETTAPFIGTTARDSEGLTPHIPGNDNIPDPDDVFLAFLAFLAFLVFPVFLTRTGRTRSGAGANSQKESAR